MQRVETFEEQRPFLFALAYRMLATRTEAEDVVQESFLRWQSAADVDIASPKAYLATVVTRLSIDTLRSAQRKREQYTGPWLPEPMIEPAPDPIELAESLSMAFLLILESLTPVERAVFLLHEVFDYGYAEIAAIADRSEENCRQIVSRAKKHVAERRPRFAVDPVQQQAILARFITACQTGDLDGLVSTLKDDITLYSDGGGKVLAALNPIHGADRVARFLLGVIGKIPADAIPDYRLTTVNGQPGIAASIGGSLVNITILDMEDAAIRYIYIVANPEKLPSLAAILWRILRSFLRWRRYYSHMPEWNADVYLSFASERTQPSIDLTRRVNLAAPRRIIDLGCGPGNSTEVLRQCWPDSSIVGRDSSKEMIEAARAAYPESQWMVGDASTWIAEEPYDLVFSNAMLQWLPNHRDLCRHLFAQLAPGGALAVQMPAHYDSPLHLEIMEVSHDPAWDHRMEAARTALTREPPSLYFDVFEPLAARLDLWETTYYHVLPGPEGVLQWFRGTGLRPFLESLATDEERNRFEAMLLERYTQAYPRRASGHVLFPFRRMFFVAYR